MFVSDLENERIIDLKRNIILNKNGGAELLTLAKKGEVILNSKELSYILGISQQYCNRLVDEFLEITTKKSSNYPKYSVIKPTQKIRLVWFLPFLHFFAFRALFGTPQEKYIPKYTKDFFADCY